MQGYKENEYEVLEQSDDIEYISDREIELQKSYGYKVDRKLYKNLFNKMKINATEQTSTFPVPLNKLKGRLSDNIGLNWKTSFGQFEITKENISWIMANAKESMYNNNRSYIYNKAFYEAFFNPIHTPDTTVERFDLIRSWAAERGIYDEGNTHTQYVKLMEEAGELAEALLKKDDHEIWDAIGDMVVVLTNLAHQTGMDIEQCIDNAYHEISQRTGKMVNGTFVKDAD
jgi:NTP pyrophosphatase (non-canonical NTP hydrolase)